MHRLLLLLFVFTVTPVSAEQALHREVEWALGWTIPQNKCTKPNMVSHSYNVKDEEGSRPVTDVDSYAINRYERKEKRWEKCVDRYKKTLLEDLERLKGSAQYGLTQDQANQILEHMAMLQQVYLSDGGRLAEESESIKE